ncbi:DUF3572 domain-containing protein [Labrys okinawensis]|uniref:DUF3572 domain-containing protein n=1 Tax=Labrys okinawensis TaxID=346911 RepID=UPI0039BC613A
MLRQRGGEEAQKQRAEEIAARALGFIAGDQDRLANFFALTGLAPDEIRGAVSQPGFLASVLQHVLSDEDSASAFAAENGLTPEDLQRAAARLGLHWD